MKIFDSIGTSATLLLRVSQRCSSNCVSCELPYIKENSIYDLVNLPGLLDIIDEKFSLNFEVGILGYNLLDSLPFEKLDSRNRNFSIQISVNDLPKVKDMILPSNVSLGIQESINTPNDINRIIRGINYIESNKLKIKFNILINFNKFTKILNYFKMKYYYQYSFGLYKFIFPSNVIEFEDSSNLDSIISLGNEDCISLKNFFIINDKILIKDDVELTLNGNIKFHLNQFCNKGILKISNIYQKNIDILKDFQKFHAIIQSNNNSSNRCKECVSNPINIT